MTEGQASNMSRLINDSVQVKKDLDTIEREYIRKLLFPKVKFLYSDDDLDDGGRIHQNYLEECMDGPFKVGAGYICGDEEIKSYLRYLWTNHVRERGLCKKWLSSRRSTVYTVMQHKFRSK